MPLEAIEFSALEEVQGLRAVVIGISPDTCESHARFIGKHNLTVLLLSDPEKKVLELFGLAAEEDVRQGVHGGGQGTVLVSPRGEVARTWKNVKAAGHAAKVLEALKEATV